VYAGKPVLSRPEKERKIQLCIAVLETLGNVDPGVESPLSIVCTVTRDRCFDFRNIFAEKLSKKIGVFDKKPS
jgi:hypothetical protein